MTTQPVIPCPDGKFEEWWRDAAREGAAFDLTVIDGHVALVARAAWSAATSEAGATIERLTKERDDAREAIYTTICHDAHCEFDCEGWREAVETFRESHGTRTAKELIEEFQALLSNETTNQERG
jgi:hypothetical protein